jgi:ribosome-binding ATPase YchF (GTP1/OBG family)
MSLLSKTDDSLKSASGIDPVHPYEEVELEILTKREEVQKKSEEILKKSEERAKKKRESINILEEESEEAEMANENTLPRAASTRRRSKRLVCIASPKACCFLCPLFRVIHAPLLSKVNRVFTF